MTWHDVTWRQRWRHVTSDMTSWYHVTCHGVMRRHMTWRHVSERTNRLLACLFNVSVLSLSIHINWFLLCVSIACCAERCTSYSKSVRLSVCPSHAGTVSVWHATIMGSLLEDSPMTLVSSWLTSVQNSKGNTRSKGAEWESPYIRNGAR